MPEDIALLPENSIYYSLGTRLLLGVLPGNRFESSLTDNMHKFYPVSFKPHMKYAGGFKALCLYCTTAQCSKAAQ